MKNDCLEAKMSQNPLRISLPVTPSIRRIARAYFGGLHGCGWIELEGWWGRDVAPVLPVHTPAGLAIGLMRLAELAPFSHHGPILVDGPTFSMDHRISTTTPTQAYCVLRFRGDSHHGNGFFTYCCENYGEKRQIVHGLRGLWDLSPNDRQAAFVSLALRALDPDFGPLPG